MTYPTEYKRPGRFIILYDEESHVLLERDRYGVIKKQYVNKAKPLQ